MVQEFDICIIGAGILGAAVARELSRYPLDILWLEKAEDVATGVTRGNTSIVHSGFDDAKGSVKGRYSPFGAPQIEALERQLQFGFYKCGSLVVARHKSGLPQLQKLLHNGQSNGVPGLEIWSAAQLREREPHLHPEAVAALFAPQSGVVLAPEFCIALAENALANGVELHLDEEVLAVHPAVPSGQGHSDNCGYVVESPTGRYGCRYLVNAAGWGALHISRMLGTLDYRLQAVKGQYLVFDRSCGTLAQHVLFPLPDKVAGKGVTVCPTYHGNLLLGPDAEFVADPADLSTQLPNLQAIYRKGLELVPGIPRNKVIRSYAGMRPRLAAGQPHQDHRAAGDFLIRYAPDRCELIAIASPGITAALPLAAELGQKVVECWRHQSRRELAAKPRFISERRPYIGSQRHKQFVSGKEIKKYTDLPLENPECFICRCEQVQSAVIRDVLRRSPSDFVAMRRNLDYIKWRSRATMGFCQGQFCKPRLKALLAKSAGLCPQDIVEYADSPRRSERIEIALLRSSL